MHARRRVAEDRRGAGRLFAGQCIGGAFWVVAFHDTSTLLDPAIIRETPLPWGFRLYTDGQQKEGSNLMQLAKVRCADGSTRYGAVQEQRLHAFAWPSSLGELLNAPDPFALAKEQLQRSTQSLAL